VGDTGLEPVTPSLSKHVHKPPNTQKIPDNNVILPDFDPFANHCKIVRFYACFRGIRRRKTVTKRYGYAMHRIPHNWGGTLFRTMADLVRSAMGMGMVDPVWHRSDASTEAKWGRGMLQYGRLDW